MSMIGYFLRADEDITEKIRNGQGSGFLFGNDSFGNDDDDKILCIDKAWHAIHYIVTGCVWDIPEDNLLGQLVLGGEPIDDEDLGYGPARLIPKETVSQISENLEKWDEAVFHENFHMQDMISNEIYPVMSDEDEESFFEYIWENFAELKKFYIAAAEDGQNVIAFLA